ncbi:MAG: YpdA family putative bacillithiol disulfide reductase [Gemmatimonadaceae bacterium]|nr:YpdA family putative bacillithiol disulfide reductase [Gemmatimonadaceae bacterium]
MPDRRQDDATDVVVVGAGPCGLAAAISLERAGYRVLVVDAECVTSSITHYPTYATFFSTAEKLSLGGLPFVISDAKPTRRDALTYYRAVVQHFDLTVRQFERVVAIEGAAPQFTVRTRKRSGTAHAIACKAVVVATGYWGSPNRLNVSGEELAHVSHAYREGHVAFQQRAVVVGGGNSAAEAALDLWRAGAQVTLVHFGPAFDKKIKPWILPDLNNRIAEGAIDARWNSRVVEIRPEAVEIATADGATTSIPADHVFLLTGFAPNMALLRGAGVPTDAATGIPSHTPETLETTVPGLFIAGVVTAGFDANKVFIENGRFHGDAIAARLKGEAPPAAPRLSRELDT